MRTFALAATILLAGLAAAFAQQAPNLQNEADKGIKTHNSGASGYVGEQDKPGAAAQMPGSAGSATAGGMTTEPGSAASGTGVAGAPGNKNGPAAGTVGAAPNSSVQQQDSSNVQGLPGNKSGPPAKR